LDILAAKLDFEIRIVKIMKIVKKNIGLIERIMN